MFREKKANKENTGDASSNCRNTESYAVNNLSLLGARVYRFLSCISSAIGYRKIRWVRPRSPPKHIRFLLLRKTFAAADIFNTTGGGLDLTGKDSKTITQLVRMLCLVESRIRCGLEYLFRTLPVFFHLLLPGYYLFVSFVCVFSPHGQRVFCYLVIHVAVTARRCSFAKFLSLLA